VNCPACQAENEAAAAACAACGASLTAPTQFVVAPDLQPGTLFHGRYEIRGLLGRGGMGMVYEARDRTLDEAVAIKVLRPDFAQDPRMAERFRSEIKLARKVRHRNICAIHDYGEDRGLLYISMELIGGTDLKRILRQRGALPPAEAYDVAIQIAEGLEAVHEAGIIHRDLKTPNIMVDSRGVARLMDFGIAKREGDSSLTVTGQVVGTPEYMSPEQAHGGKVDFRSDLYALGVVSYEVFTGRVPFRGETPISTILMHLHDPPPLEGGQAAQIPAALKPVLGRALAKESARRYASAKDFADALRQARHASGQAGTAPTVAFSTPTRRPPSSPRRPIAPWLLVVPTIAIAGSLYVLRPWSAPPLPTPSPAPSPEAMATPTPLPLAAEPRPAVEPPTTLTAATPSPRPAPRATPTPAAAGRGRPSPGPLPTAQVLATPSPAPTSVPTPAPTPAPTPPPSTPPSTPAPERALGAGLLQVAVRPWGEVAVDGVVVGTTPLDKIAVAAGPHVVRVHHPAYEILERRVSIQPGQTERLVVDLPSEGRRKP
jgi:serine/threonine-protein kinase